ncbi:hypothetical protein QQ045_002408 [Rhodiola kirilowii]
MQKPDLWIQVLNLKKKLMYRILSKSACDILAIPITSVALESAFSAGSRVIDPYRASLGIDTVQMLLCGGDWLRKFYFYNIKKKRNNDEQDTKEILFRGVHDGVNDD